MPKEKISAYIAKTRAYLSSPEGRIGMANCRAWGYSYQQRMSAAVMTATHLRTYERITEVVQAIAREELAVPAA